MRQFLTLGTKAALHPLFSAPHGAKMYGLLLSVDGRARAYGGAEMTPPWCQLHASYEFAHVSRRHEEGDKCAVAKVRHVPPSAVTCVDICA